MLLAMVSLSYVWGIYIGGFLSAFIWTLRDRKWGEFRLLAVDGLVTCIILTLLAK